MFNAHAKPADGFFCDVDFKGAFGKINWAAGWTIIGESGILSDAGAGIPDYPLKELEGGREITDVTIAPDSTHINFTIFGEAGKTYTLQSISDPGSSSWNDVKTIDGQGTSINVSAMINGAPDSVEFFRFKIK